MSGQSGIPEKLRDPSAKQAFQQLVETLRAALLSEASKVANGESITEDDIYLAYKRLNFPNKDTLQFADAQAVISQAWQENRVLEWVSYAMAISTDGCSPPAYIRDGFLTRGRKAFAFLAR